MAYNFQQLKKTLDSASGAELKRFLSNKILETESIMTIDDKKDIKEVGFDAKVQKRVFNKLVDIFKDILTISTSVSRKRSPKDSFDVLP